MDEQEFMSLAGQGVGARTAKVEIGDLERMVSESPSAEQVCLKLARIFSVHRNEIALLRIEKGSLRFIFPVELRAAGLLPLTGTAVAARSATTHTPFLSNSFTRVRHASLFEAVRLSSEDEDSNSDQMPIQKIISAPITTRDGVVLGVVQVSHKGLDAQLTGPDFTAEDMKMLTQVAGILQRMPFMQPGAEI